MTRVARKILADIRHRPRAVARTISYLRESSVAALQILHSTLREIFEESAYARFLERRHLANSTDAYAEFLTESRHQRERRPRCC